MGRLRAVVLLAAALLTGPAAALAPVPATLEAGDDPALRSWVVIAVIDTGINPYHAAFRAPGLDAHPSTYVRGYPPEAQALALCLDAAAEPGCTTLDGALAHDHDPAHGAPWSAVRRTTQGADGAWGPLYYVPGTRIVGAVSVGAADDGFTGAHRILDDRGHGTATASLAAGEGLGACPRCLLVAVEGPGDVALAWARDQPWIDVVTNSWGVVANLDWPPPPFGEANAAVTKAMVLQGKTVLFSAGNGLGTGAAEPVSSMPDYLLPGESTYTSAYTGPDWVVTVGAVDPHNGQTIAGSARPVDIAAAGLDTPAASAFSRNGTFRFAGTSASAPIAAGVFGAALLHAREALGDTAEGPREVAGLGQVLAQGLAVACAPGALAACLAAPAGDGLVTRDELQRAVYAAARPCALAPSCPMASTAWPAPARVWGWTLPTPPVAYPLLVGYGTVGAASADDAARILLGDTAWPARPEADLWARSDSLIRQQLWGLWDDGARPLQLLPL